MKCRYCNGPHPGCFCQANTTGGGRNNQKRGGRVNPFNPTQMNNDQAIEQVQLSEKNLMAMIATGVNAAVDNRLGPPPNTKGSKSGSGKTFVFSGDKLKQLGNAMGRYNYYQNPRSGN